MINERYKRAFTETLYYLKGIRKEDINKIPVSFMSFLEKNCSKEYECSFDYTKPLKDLKLMDETKGVISMICLNYWCETQEQKNSFLEHLNNNEKKYQEKLRKLYNPDDLFKNEEPKIVPNSTEMIESKESIFVKIYRKIRQFIKRNV